MSLFVFLLQKPKCNFLENLDQDCVQLFRRAVIDMVSIQSRLVI